jgi:hypothetical protein
MIRTITSLPFSILILASFFIIGCAPSQKSPGEVVKAYYIAANEGNFSELEETLSEGAKSALKSHRGQLGGGIKGACDRESRNRSIIRVDITKEEIRGDGATVTANISFKDGSTKSNDKTHLIREKGSWKIAQGT